MSSKVSFSKPALFVLSWNGRKSHGTRHLPCKMEMQPKTSTIRVEEEESIQLRKLSSPHVERSSSSSYLRFNKLQQFDRETNEESRVFGDFLAREALLDEEYWTAAWLRAESHWEDRPNERYANSYKRQYAEQEFNALKRRCKGYHGQRSTCIVTVKKEIKNVQRTVIKSLVGTLDLSIRHLLQGETFPGERVKAPLFCSNDKMESRYGYVANVCVTRSARRKGIAINMMKFAIESAKSKGAEQIYVHVHRKNTSAQLLYQKLGFEIVDVASPQLVEEQTYLLCLQT